MQESRVWDTKGVDENDSLEYWATALSAVFVPLAPRVPLQARRSFYGRLQARSSGAAALALVASGPQQVERNTSRLALTLGDICYLNLQVCGSCEVDQGDQRVVVRPGALTLVDTARTFRFEHRDAWSLLCVALPRADLVSRSGSLERLTGRVHDTTGGAALVVRTLVEALWQLDPGDQSDDDLVAALTISMSAVLRSGACEAAEPATLRGAVQSYTLNHYDDDSLSATTVARRFNISLRYLHKLFDGTGSTFGRLLRNTRLDRCAADLAANEDNVTTIARRHGISDPSTFHRAFRRRFQMSPTEYRHQYRPRDAQASVIVTAS